MYAAISVDSGCLLQQYKLGAAFNGEDIADFLRRLRAKVGKHKKLAVFWDNASVHKPPAKEVAPGLKIAVVWNAAYRPDLNGIEFFCGRAKQLYRKAVSRLRVLDKDWDQEALVRECVQAGFECAKACSAQGWRNLTKAVVKGGPIEHAHEDKRDDSDEDSEPPNVPQSAKIGQ